MGNPTILLDGLIASCQFSAWVDAHEENKNEKTLWEMYLHKLGALDDRSFNDFKDDMMKGTVQKIEISSDEQLSATVKKSFEIFKDFEIRQEGG